MAIGNLLIVQAALLFSIVGGYSIIQKPVFYMQHLKQPPGRQIIIRDEDYGKLSCPGEGFFVHPENCTRFYRCVDYSGIGYYSRYIFECPKNHVFINVAQTCVPGHAPCTGLIQAPVIIVTESPAETTEEGNAETQSGDGSPTEEGNAETQTGDGSPTEEGNAQTQTGDGSPTEEGNAETPTAEEQNNSPPSTGEAEESAAAPASEITIDPASATDKPLCPTRFVQHPEYCNIYTPCGEESVRYVCPTGTVFDEPRQMCRISAMDDGYCTNKAVFRHPFLLRSENIGSHVVLPDSITLPRLHIDIKPHPRPLRINGKPANTPILLRNQEPVFDFEQPVFRPIISRPAQVYRRPQSSPYHVPQATFLLKPADVSTIPVVPASTRYRPLAQVRRPEGHLHFPHLDPDHFLNTYGFQREII